MDCLQRSTHVRNTEKGKVGDKNKQEQEAGRGMENLKDVAEGETSNESKEMNRNKRGNKEATKGNVEVTTGTKLYKEKNETRKKSKERNKDGSVSSVEVLPVTKLRFSAEQLKALNYHLVRKVTDCDGSAGTGSPLKTTSTHAESIVERLTQRLLCAVGNLDPRFSSKFLITLHDSNSNADKTNLEYLVRLDALSTPILYPEDTPPCCEILEYDSDNTLSGYAKIRLRNKTSTNWAEFINASGYLRRDKIQERFVELLALAAASGWPNSPLDCDESTLCAAPGKVFDAAVLSQVLEITPEERVFYGAASNNLRFPDPRDFRLAIVDEPAGIRLRVGFLAPSFAGHDVEVRLVIAIGVDAWPRTSTFPGRVPLGHAKCLMYHQCADLGMYLCAIGSHPASWQIQLPATEVTLLNHYGPNCTETVVLKILYAILDEIYSRVTEDKCKFSRKLVSRRSLRELLWGVIEENCSNPLSVMLEWTSGHTSKHVLRLLDKLVGFLRCQSQPSYFFPNCNLLELSEHGREEEFLVEANRIYMYMVSLHDTSQVNSPTYDFTYTQMCKFADLDAALVSRWNDVIGGLMPPIATRSCRFSFVGASSSVMSTSSRRRRETAVAHMQYTGRQLEYIGMVLKSMLDVKQKVMQLSTSLSDIDDTISVSEDPVEDIIYLVVTMIEQAREHSLNQGKPTTKSTKYHTKTRSQFNAATTKLVDAIRKDRKREQCDDLNAMDLTEDSLLVKAVLRWLYKGLDQSKHSLAPVLRPYLNKLFVSSHEIAWHLDSLRSNRDEIEALGAFSRLVNTGEVSPASGLIESVNKGWNWAKYMLEFVERGKLRVIFILERGKVHRHILSLPSYDRKIDLGSKSAQNTLKKVVASEEMKNRTLPVRRFQKILGNDETTILSTLSRSRTLRFNPNLISATITHQELKESSPLTETVRSTHLCGRHLCPDDLVHSLAALNKISILQELSQILPPEDRHTMLDAIHRLSKDHKRQIARRRCTTLPSNSPTPTISKSTPSLLSPLANASLFRRRRKASLPQTYTPTDEDAEFEKQVAADHLNLNRIQGREARVVGWGMRQGGKVFDKHTLIGSCRAARIKEDNRVIFQDSLKIKSLFKNDNSALLL